MSEPKIDWRLRAEKAESENAVLRGEPSKSRRIYDDHLSEIVTLKIALETVRAPLKEALAESEP